MTIKSTRKYALLQCASEPCQNDGMCAHDINGYDCQCIACYEGIHCEQNIDECASEPCQNNGTCVDGIDGYDCQCTAGYEGTHCENSTGECVNIVHVGPAIENIGTSSLTNGIVFIMARHVLECDGVVSSWEFWPEVSVAFRAMVFRPDSSGDLTKWTIVGINDIPASDVMADQMSVSSVQNNEQIVVQTGDVIGIGQNQKTMRTFIGNSPSYYKLMSNTSALIAGEIVTNIVGPQSTGIILAAKVSAPS
ncbi:uncharacterized protein [Amphiura filiformis]|uniref:uncharacterized protein n=1 Tax=Amphiura filiformis TaxID=82378 RepID=UPI003B227249